VRFLVGLLGQIAHARARFSARPAFVDGAAKRFFPAFYAAKRLFCGKFVFLVEMREIAE